MKYPIGGQAVIEGVMLRRKNKVATAIREPSGNIIVKKETFNSVLYKNNFLRLPIIRGIIAFFEMSILGIKLLTYSSNIALNEHEELSITELSISLLIAISFGIGLFKLFPFFSATMLTNKLNLSHLSMNVIEMGIKIILFIGYVALIGLFPDIKRLYQYHGAEHKTVNCYEAGEKMTVKNIKKFTKRQPRCGTTFIILVLFSSFVFYVFIPDMGFWLSFLIRILLLPFIAGLTYELIKIISNYYDRSSIIRLLFLPGLLFQDLTTREPDNKQIAVALASFKSLLTKK